MYQIIRSQRRTLAVEINRSGEIIVRAPMRMPEGEIHRFLASKQDWIQRHLQARSAQQPPFTPAELEELKKAARKDLPARAARYAALMGVHCGRITIRAQKTRWGSCSAGGNLNFNCLLMLCPPEIRDYVAVHELCHLKEMNHSPRFWQAVEQTLPDYRARRQWLKQNGPALIRRLG